LVGEPKYGADFKHYDYANPDAPKGGTFRAAAFGTFDSFNSFALKGKAAAGLGYQYDNLMESSDDEPSTYYGLIAESLEYPDDYSYVIFNLRKNARWHDGKPITADDVVFSFNTITSVSPFMKNYYKLIKSAEALGKYRVKFEFDENETSYEMPLIAGQLTIIPKHYWQSRDLSKGSTDIPMGSGPYRIVHYEMGKTIEYERVKDYWAKDVPLNKGRYNFDRIIYEYYRDQTVAFEAFKAGHYDFRSEGSGKRWYKGYTGKYFDIGLIKKEEIPHKRPMGMAGIVLNTSAKFLDDIYLREALTYAYDYEWINNNIKYGQNIRHRSYFSNSELAATGDASPEEIEFMKSVGADPDKYAPDFKLYETDGKGNNREGLKKAVILLENHGYSIKDGKMYAPNGEHVSLEILTASKSLEKEFIHFKTQLERIGIDFYIRYVDSTQYVRLARAKEYMMIFTRVRQSQSPGNEQRDMWGSKAADTAGTRNYANIKNPLIDKIVEKLINSKNREKLMTAAKVLDRVLMRGYYVIPSGYSDRYRISYWDKFDKPDVMPGYALGFSTWWVVPEKEERISRQVNR